MSIRSKIMGLFGLGSVEHTSTSKSQSVTGSLINAEAKDIVDLVRRMREDEQVKFSEIVLCACVKRIDVFVTTESTDPRAVALADRLQTLWETSLDDFLESIAFGRAAFERIFCYDEGLNLRVNERLDYLPFELTEMVLAGGRFNGIVVGRGDNKMTLEKHESLWVAIDTNALNPHGRSRFLGAPYKVWQRRQRVTGKDGLEEKFLARFALRGGVAHVQATVTDEKTGQQIDNLAATAAAYQEMQAGGLMIFDNTMLEENKYANDISESPSALDPTPITNVVDKLDIRMLRAFGIPEKTVIDNGAGSFDLVSLQMLILWAVCEGILGQIVDAFQEGVIDPSIADNFDLSSGISIKATFTPPSQQPDSVLVEVAKSLMTSGSLSPIVLSGGVDVRKILDAVGIPVTADLEQRLTVILSQLAKAADQPPGPPIAMSNLQDDFPEDAPDQHDLQSSALANLDALFARLLQAASQRDEEAVKRVCEQINDLHAQTRLAAQMIGRLTPIKPALQSAPKGAGPKPVALKSLANPLVNVSPNDDKTPAVYYPFIERAAAYLQSKEVMTHAELQSIPARVRHTMFSVAGVDSVEIIAAIRSATVESTSAGETPDQFAKRIESVVDLPKAQSRTILRTQVKSAYVEGLDNTIQKPAVKSQLPYVRFVVTRDGRARPSHAAMRNKVCRIDDPLYRVMLALLRDYNCRCAIVPLNERQAAKYTISTIADLPDIVRTEYAHILN